MVVLGSLPAVHSCLSDRHVSLESHPHIPDSFSAVTTEGDRKRERNRREEGKNVCCLSQSGAFLPWLLIGSLVLSACPRILEEELELTQILSAASIYGVLYGL